MKIKKVSTDEEGTRNTEMGPKQPPDGVGRDDGRLPVEKEIEKKNKKIEKKNEKNSSKNNISFEMGM